MKRAIVIASVSSMIGKFNKPNIEVMLSQGYEVSVACNFEDDTHINKDETIKLKKWFKEKNINYYQIDFPRSPKSLKKLKKSYEQLKSLIDEHDFELMHCHTPVASVISRMAFKRYSPRTKIIYTAHGFHFYKGAPLLNWIIFYPIEKHFSRYTDVLITINKEDYNLAKTKFKSRMVEYVPGVGIDLDVFYPIAEEEKISLRDQYGFSKDDFILIYVAELNDNKNQNMLIEASSLLVKDIPNLQVLLVGQGQNYELYKNKIKKLKLEQNVHLLGYRQDVPNLLRIADISVSTSLREGLPVNILESMAVGNPIVATRCRGNADLVEASFLVEINDVNGMIFRIKEIYNSDDCQLALRMNYLKKINGYSTRVLTNILKKIYKLEDKTFV